MLQRLLAANSLPSLILWGEAGTGKTSLAKLVARTLGDARFVAMSALSSNVGELRKVFAAAESGRAFGQKTVLFLDECHRFNKAQQDVLLGAVEKGDITFIGATTQNPSFSVVNALLSRTTVLVLKPLSADDLSTIIARAIESPQGLDNQVSLADKARKRLIELSGG